MNCSQGRIHYTVILAWRPSGALRQSLTDETRGFAGVSAIVAAIVDRTDAASLRTALPLPASTSAAFGLVVVIEAR